jgi:hypothetical protein
MGDTWISDIGHFLDEDGMIPFDLPGPASRLAHYFGSNVSVSDGISTMLRRIGRNTR